MNKFKVIATSVGVTLALSLVGCGTGNVKHQSAYESSTQPVSLGHIPAYYMDYSTGYNKDGLFIAAGYGQGITPAAALSEAMDKAQVRAAQTKGSSYVSSLTRHYDDSHTGNGYTGVQKYNNGNNADSTTTSVNEVSTPQVQLGHVFVLNRTVYKTSHGYESYILISNKPRNPDIDYGLGSKAALTAALNRQKEQNKKNVEVNKELTSINSARVQRNNELNQLHKSELKSGVVTSS